MPPPHRLSGMGFLGCVVLGGLVGNDSPRSFYCGLMWRLRNLRGDHYIAFNVPNYYFMPNIAGLMS